VSVLNGQGLETIEQFHHYVAALENALAGKEGRVGSDALPSSELLRFRACTHLGFPGKAVEKIVEPNGERSQYQLLVGFLGLIGPSGVMPRHFSERALRETKKRDAATADFLDIFHHRLIALYHRAWEKHHHPTLYQHYLQTGVPDAVTRMLCVMSGAQSDLEARYAGLLTLPNRNTKSLKQILEHMSGCDVDIEERVGRWLHVEPDQQSRLASRIEERGQFSCLGEGVLVGKRVWDVNSTIAITLRTHSRTQAERYMPKSPALKILKGITKAYLPTHIHSVWQLAAKTGDLPVSTVGATDVGLGHGTLLAYPAKRGHQIINISIGTGQ
jgi:type VI secretion system protein ImpH